MIYCITLIIIVAIICATRIFPAWIEYKSNEYRKELAEMNDMKEKCDFLDKAFKQSQEHHHDEYSSLCKEYAELCGKYDKLYEKSIESKQTNHE